MTARSISQYTPDERNERFAMKRHKLLTLLADEIYTTTDLAAMALSLKRTAAYQTLASMEKDGLLIRDSIVVHGREKTLWGISSLGLAHANRELTQATYEIGRVSHLAAQHHLVTQSVRLCAELAGWTNWQAGRLLFNRRLPKVPDAISNSPSSETVAFEVEMNPKTTKRYRDIVAAHLLAIKAGHWSHVVYLSPSILVPRLRNLFHSLTYVNVPNLGKAVLTAEHLSRFQFIALESWNGKNFIG